MKKRNKLLIAVLVILFLSFGIGGVAAKYVRSRDHIGVAKALEFYLTSNMLPGDHTLPPGTTQVSFKVGNYADDLRHAEMDIDVTVTVTHNATKEPTLSQTSFKLETGDTKSEHTITLSNLENGKTYTVTVTGNGGYVQVLTGTFTVLSPETGPFYYIENKYEGEVLAYTEVTVWCRGIAGPTDVTLEYTGNTIPDNTNPHMVEWKIGDPEKKITLKPYESYRFQFFNAETINVDGASWNPPA